MTHRFQHPMVLSDEHRPFTPLDYSIPKTPLRDVLADYTEHPGGEGWTASTIIDGRLHRIRGGGRKMGPRSVNLDSTNPGVYAVDVDTGMVFELLPKAEASPGCPLYAIDLKPYGYAPETIPGWCWWGPEPKTNQVDIDGIFEVP